jgi:hypothetical protein
MHLADELRENLASYIRGEIPLSDVRLWLAGHVQAIADEDDPALDATEGLAWLLISEYDDRQRDESSIRFEMLRELADTGFGTVLVHGAPRPEPRLYSWGVNGPPVQHVHEDVTGSAPDGKEREAVLS